MSRCFWCNIYPTEAAARHEGPHATCCPHYRRPALPPGVRQEGKRLVLDSLMDAVRELERKPWGNDEPFVAQPDPMPAMPAPRFLRECSGSCLSRGCNCASRAGPSSRASAPRVRAFSHRADATRARPRRSQT